MYLNCPAQWFMGSAAFRSDVETGLQMFLCEQLDVLG